MLFDSCVSPDVAARMRLLLSHRDVMVCSRCCISEEGGKVDVFLGLDGALKLRDSVSYMG